MFKIKIGLRTIKTAIAIFLCGIIYAIVVAINEDYAIYYSPFFASIAAAYSIHPNKEMSLSFAKRRIIGNLIGGFFGLFIALSFSFLKFGSHFDLSLYFLIVSLGSIVLILVCLKLKQNVAIFVILVGYCSVAYNFSGSNITIIALSRISSTIFGIVISSLINIYRLPRRVNKDILFTCGVSNILKDNKLEVVMLYKLNFLLHHNAKIIFTTHLHNEELKEVFKQITEPLQFIVLNGAAIYDTKTNEFLNIIPFKEEKTLEIERYLKENNLNSLKTIIKDNKELTFYNKEGIFNTHNLIYANTTKDTTIVQFQIVDELIVLNKLKEEIEKTIDEITITIRKYDEHYYSLFINDVGATKSNQVRYLNKEEKKVISFIYKDESLVADSYKKYASNEIENKENYDGSFNNNLEVIKLIKASFFK